MPELPEVETIRRYLAGRLIGKKIVSVEIGRINILKGQEKRFVQDRFAGQTVRDWRRRGKFLLAALDRGFALIHLGMSGQIFYADHEKDCTGSMPLPNKHTHMVWLMHDGSRLFFRDPRMFGRIQWVAVPEDHPLLAAMGNELSDAKLDSEHLWLRLRQRRAPLKALLLDQKLFPGVGNIYADEAAFRAGLWPMLAGNKLKRAGFERLLGALRQVLSEAIAARGTTFSDYCDPRHAPGGFQQQLRVYGREKEPCLTCGSKIQRAVIAQRSTHYCPACQPGVRISRRRNDHA
jgi:formamidopyrimidine-DNA glycosylase